MGKWVEWKIDDRRQVIRERRKEGGKEKWAKKHKKIKWENGKKDDKKERKREIQIKTKGRGEEENKRKGAREMGAG